MTYLDHYPPIPKHVASLHRIARQHGCWFLGGMRTSEGYTNRSMRLTGKCGVCLGYRYLEARAIEEDTGNTTNHFTSPCWECNQREYADFAVKYRLVGFSFVPRLNNLGGGGSSLASLLATGRYDITYTR